MKLGSRFLAVASAVLIVTPLFAAQPTLEVGPTLCRGANCGKGSVPVVGDFNGDGLDDVLVGNLLFFNREGAFAAPIFATGIPTNQRVNLPADYNGDGITDVVSHDWSFGSGQGPDSVRLGAGDGAFMAREGAGIYNTIATVDLDGDARPDLVGRAVEKLLIFRNRGNVVFEMTQALPFDYSTITDNPNIAAADLNGDGVRDLLTAGRDHLYFYFGDASGQFRPAVKRYIGLNNSALDLKIVDVNVDGHLDIVFQSSGVTVLFGDGKGQFPSFATAAVNPSVDVNAWQSSLTVAPLFGGAPQIVATMTDGTVVSFVASTTGSLREIARTRVDIFRAGARAGHFRSRTQFDLLAGGQTKDMTANIAQLVFADGTLAATTSRSGRSRSILRAAPGDGFSGTYDIQWTMACPPAISSVELARTGAFIDARTSASGMTVEASHLGELGLRLRDAAGHEYAGYLAEDNGTYTGLLMDYTDGRTTPRIQRDCDGSTAIFRLRLTKR